VRPRTANRYALGRQTGFTLLEMLVALVVLGFLMIGLTQGVRAGLALWDAQTRRVGETAELKGSTESLAFVGDLPTGLGITQRADITLELRQGRLVLRWTPHRHELSNAPAPQPVETELIRGVDRIDLAYWGSPSPEQPAGWQAQWDGPAIPELIRLRLAFAKGDRRRFPDLIAAPQL
jgi:general secretion pathway protein J